VPVGSASATPWKAAAVWPREACEAHPPGEAGTRMRRTLSVDRCARPLHPREFLRKPVSNSDLPSGAVWRVKRDSQAHHPSQQETDSFAPDTRYDLAFPSHSQFATTNGFSRTDQRPLFRSPVFFFHSAGSLLRCEGGRLLARGTLGSRFALLPDVGHITTLVLTLRVTFRPGKTTCPKRFHSPRA